MDPVQYLATALVCANLSAEQVEQAVEIMSDCTSSFPIPLYPTTNDTT